MRQKDTPCSIPECPNFCLCKDLCKLHYNRIAKGYEAPTQLRVKKYRDLGMKESFNSQNWSRLLEQLRDACHLKEDTGCWIWQRSTDNNGYGHINFNQKKNNFKAHRLSMMCHLGGGIPPHQQVHHHCPGGPNKLCINPEHLQLTSQRENIAEMHERKYYRAVITDQARRIKHLESEVSRLQALINDSTLIKEITHHASN